MLYANTFIASSLCFSQPFMLLMSGPKHLLMLENTASTMLLTWYSSIHSSGLSEYASNEICHAGYPFALAVAFALKQRNGFPPLSATAWQLMREEYALSPVALWIRGKSRISRLNSLASAPFQSVIVWPEVCFYTIVCPAKRYLHENTDGDDSWIPAWTTEQIAFPWSVCGPYCTDYGQEDKPLEVPIYLVGDPRRYSLLWLSHTEMLMHNFK